jgi:very-short-patch-repair endonuclease
MSPHHRWRTTVAIAGRARDLRKDMTNAERRLWSCVRHDQLNGLRIRRQHAIDHFIVDFYHAPSKLVIEIDGAVHAEPAQRAHDEMRDAWFIEHGYRVLRFTNDDVFRRLDGVLAKIIEMCEEAPTQPPPSDGSGSG